MGALDRRWRLIAYDVRAPERWRRLYRLLRGHGQPLQYSVFRCRLDDREFERLRWEIARILTREDRLLIVPLCPSCSSRVVSRGHVEDWDDEQPTFVILDATERKQAPERVGLPRAPKGVKGSRSRRKSAVS